MIKLFIFCIMLNAIMADVDLWGQCGGSNYSGDKKCKSGSQCKAVNEWYSQCQPGNGQSETTSSQAQTTARGAVSTSSTGTSTGSEAGKPNEGVYSTRHGANEAGACSLPEEDYAIQYPVALGNIPELGDLKFHPRLCGHVLNIDCGNGPLDIVINNSNLGGGLDLYASTWAVATKNLPPGVTKCKVKLTNKNVLKSSTPKCYYDTNETNNEYFRKFGLINTGGKLVESAKVNNIVGTMADSAPYFSFMGQSKASDIVTFTFTDKTTYQVAIKDCKAGATKHMWK